MHRAIVRSMARAVHGQLFGGQRSVLTSRADESLVQLSLDGAGRAARAAGHRARCRGAAPGDAVRMGSATLGAPRAARGVPRPDLLAMHPLLPAPPATLAPAP